MNRFKYDAFLREFPFLEDIFDGFQCSDCDSIGIERIDSNLLNYVPSEKLATGSLVGIRDIERVDFVLRSWDVVICAVRPSGSAVHNEAHCDNESWSGESVLEAIYRRGLDQEIEYIIKVESGYKVRDHHSLANWCATIYKPASGDLISDLLAEARDAAAAEVAAALEF